MSLITLFAWDTTWFFLVLGALLLGGIAGFFIARYVFKKQLEKNPPISEAMIRAMFRSMGKKPSEAQVRSVMNSIKKSSSL